ncbi:MAG TPA: hypothetical protein VF502_00100 [Stellaceae bacterium]
MKHLLGGVAIAALITAGAPAWAQNSNVSQSKQAPQAETQSGTSSTGTSTSMPAATDNAPSGATTPSDSTGKAGKHAGTARSLKAQRGTSPEDNMAEELNRQELQRVTQGSGQTTGSGQTQAPANQGGAAGAGSTGGSR